MMIDVMSTIRRAHISAGQKNETVRIFILPTVVQTFECLNIAHKAATCHSAQVRAMEAPWVIRHFDQTNIRFSSRARPVMIFVLYGPSSDWLLSGLCENDYISGSSPHDLI
jgi:hypothetical protein